MYWDRTSGRLTLRFLACKTLTVILPFGGPMGATGVMGVLGGGASVGVSVPDDVV